MKLKDALLNVNLVGLDTSPFIYFVERHPLYVDVMREVFRRITDGDLKASSSVITLTEVLVQPLRQKDKTLADKYRNLLYKAANFKLLPISFLVSETAAELRAKYNLRTPDALQIAAALENGCEAFLCNDNGLKRVTELKVLILDELTL